MMGASTAGHASSGGTFELTKQQKAYFESFGFLRIPGLFADDIDRIIGGFEAVFRDDAHIRMDTREDLHLNKRRLIIPSFIDKSPDLRWLLDDDRVNGVVRGLVGDDYAFAESDGNLFFCDSSWHPDTYAAPMEVFHVKLSFYLDSLGGESGAIRMIPGTNHHMVPFVHELKLNLKDPRSIIDIYGVEYDQIPSWTLESEPGDLIVWNYRTIHASFNGGERRRLFSMNFREAGDMAELRKRR